MTTLHEAAKQALEALKLADNIALVGAAYTPRSIEAGIGKIRAAIEALRSALAPQAQQEPVAWPALNQEEHAALERFNETCEDGQEYDVPKAMMQRLSEIGVVCHLFNRVFCITEVGRATLDYSAPQPAQQDHIPDAGKMAAQPAQPAMQLSK